MTSRQVILFLTVFVSGLLQNTNILNVYGIKPNITLAVLIAASFFLADFLVYLAAVLFVIVILIFQGSFQAEQLILGLLAIAAFFAEKQLHWRPILGNLVLIGAGTVIFYLLSSPAFLIGNPALVLGELAYNLFLGIIFFKIFESWLTNSILKT